MKTDNNGNVIVFDSDDAAVNGKRFHLTGRISQTDLAFDELSVKRSMVRENGNVLIDAGGNQFGHLAFVDSGFGGNYNQIKDFVWHS